jgi:hypothetical protein
MSWGLTAAAISHKTHLRFISLAPLLDHATTFFCSLRMATDGFTRKADRIPFVKVWRLADPGSPR